MAAEEEAATKASRSATGAGNRIQHDSADKRARGRSWQPARESSEQNWSNPFRFRVGERKEQNSNMASKEAVAIWPEPGRDEGGKQGEPQEREDNSIKGRHPSSMFFPVPLCLFLPPSVLAGKWIARPLPKQKGFQYPTFRWGAAAMTSPTIYPEM